MQYLSSLIQNISQSARRGLVLTYVVMGVLFSFPGEKEQVYDVVTGKLAVGFSVAHPWWHTFIAPFLDVPNYFIHMVHYRTQVPAWFLWIEFFVLVVCIIRRISLGATLRALLKTLLVFFLVIGYVLFVPYAGNKLVTPNTDNVAVDYHSHTWYSWDGIASPRRSLSFHAANGYNAFASTEHDVLFTDFERPDIVAQNNNNLFVFFGSEIYDAQGTHHILYGMPFGIRVEQVGRTYKEIQNIVARNNGVMEATCWWLSEEMNALSNKNITALEIANMGHWVPTEHKRAAVRAAREKNISLLGVTDWHGWGHVAYVWTIVTVNRWDTLTAAQKQQALLDALRGEKKYPVTVLRYGRHTERDDVVRQILEPFFGVYYYFSSVNIFTLLSWMLWLALGVALFSRCRQYEFWFFYSTLYAVFGCVYLMRWIPLSSMNIALRDVFCSFFFLALLALCVGFITYRRRQKSVD